MGIFTRSTVSRKSNETMRLIVTTIVGVVFGFFIGLSFPTLSLTKLNLSSNILTTIDFKYTEYTKSSPSSSARVQHPISDNGSSDNVVSKKVLDVCCRSERFSLGKQGNSTEVTVVQMPFKLLNSGASSIFHFQQSVLYRTRLNGIVFRIWVPSNPRGAERLPPRIVRAESDLYLRRLWGKPSEDLTSTPKYLVTFTVGYNQRKNIDAAVKKFSGNFTILLFHYDGRTTEWNEFEWARQAIHVSVPKQTKWWYAKRFLHPDIVAPYEYIFIWDEDLGVQHFNAEEYIRLVRKYGLDISQPGLEPNKGLTWQMTKRRGDREVHKETVEKAGWCNHPHVPPCAAFVEIMAPVFSRDAWRCVWYMIQNDLVHGWGLDFALRKCVEPAHEKIGVVDAQWIVHQSLPSLGNQGEAQEGKAPWQGVRERCKKEWAMFQTRFSRAEKAYFKAINSSSH